MKFFLFELFHAQFIKYIFPSCKKYEIKNFRIAALYTPLPPPFFFVFFLIITLMIQFVVYKSPMFLFSIQFVT